MHTIKRVRKFEELENFAIDLSEGTKFNCTNSSQKVVLSSKEWISTLEKLLIEKYTIINSILE